MAARKGLFFVSSSLFAGICLRSLFGIPYNARKDPSGFLPIFPVLLPELLHHHLFLAAYPRQILGQRGEDKRITSDPVGQHQGSGDAPEDMGSIHRVADIAEYAIRDQGMFRANTEGRRPVESQIGMRAPQQPGRRREQHCPDPAGPLRQPVVGNVQPVGKEIDQRQEHRDAGHRQQEEIRPGLAVDGDRQFTIAGRLRLSDDYDQDKPDEIDDFEEVIRHNDHKILFGSGVLVRRRLTTI